MAAKRVVFIVLLALAAGAFDIAPRSPQAQGREPPPPCTHQAFEGDRFVVCRYVPATDEIRLAWRANGVTLGGFAALHQALGKDAESALFAMNAGMYDDERRPVGHYVEKGRQLKSLNRRAGPGNFHLLPNGVFWVDAAGRHKSPDAPPTASRAVPALRPGSPSRVASPLSDLPSDPTLWAEFVTWLQGRLHVPNGVTTAAEVSFM